MYEWLEKDSFKKEKGAFESSFSFLLIQVTMDI